MVAMTTDTLSSIFELSFTTSQGETVPLATYEGRPLLVVNTASQCGLTPQYKGLEEVYQKYKDQGFEVLAFPANEFGSQEPGTDVQIKEFCSTKYKVSFPLFSKVVVKGKGDPSRCTRSSGAGRPVVCVRRSSGTSRSSSSLPTGRTVKRQARRRRRKPSAPTSRSSWAERGLLVGATWAFGLPAGRARVRGPRLVLAMTPRPGDSPIATSSPMPNRPGPGRTWPCHRPQIGPGRTRPCECSERPCRCSPSASCWPPAQAPEEPRQRHRRPPHRRQPRAKPPRPPQAPSLINLEDSKLGKVLADGWGKTLYVFTVDAAAVQLQRRLREELARADLRGRADARHGLDAEDFKTTGTRTRSPSTATRCTTSPATRLAGDGPGRLGASRSPSGPTAA